MKTKIALICGVPNTCVCCMTADAKAIIVLPNKGQFEFCEDCIVKLINVGIETVLTVLSAKIPSPELYIK